MTKDAQQDELDRTLAECEEALVSKVLNETDKCVYLASERSHRGGIKIRSMRSLIGIDTAHAHAENRKTLNLNPCRYYRLTEFEAPKLVTSLILR